jgi:putative ABC transport system ATP-binding protein
MHCILRAEKISKCYKPTDQSQPVLKNIDLRIQAGKFTVFMGPSGSGKSTLLHLLGGLDLPSSGEVFILGQSISGYNENQLAKLRRQHIGFVFQDQNLIHQLTLEENILLPGYLVNKDKRAVQARSRQLMEQLSIHRLADRLPSEVSGGEGLRCAIARALINEPDILLADEPTGNLNSKASSMVLQCFQEVHQAGQSILMVTHDVLSAAYGDEIYCLKDGVFLDHVNLTAWPSIPQKKEVVANWLEKLDW